jgi:hypothetical protein
VVIVLAIEPKVCESKPIRGLWIFKGDKNTQNNFLRIRNKAVGPTSQDFTTC